MTSQQKLIGISVVLMATLTGCSQVRNLSKFGSQNETIKEDSSLIVPPSLKMPGGNSHNTSVASSTRRIPASPTRTTPVAIKRAAATKSIARSNAQNYYVVVGTYPSQAEAMDTFIRLSSIGLPNSTMETRTTRSGKRLHMVRLGPFTDQAKIDKVKDSLISDGLTQFKVVKN
jgi:cell division septation protein DedD